MSINKNLNQSAKKTGTQVIQNKNQILNSNLVSNVNANINALNNGAENPKLKAFLDSQKTDLRARNFMRQISKKSIKKFKIGTIPAKSSLIDEYKGRENQFTAEQRAKKKLNKRSRLYIKAKNNEAVLKAQNSLWNKNNERLSNAIKEFGMDMTLQTARDLSFFMASDDVNKNKELLGMYCGTSASQAYMLKVEKDGEVVETAYENQDRTKALDLMTSMLMDLDVSKISFENDEEMVKNADLLEKVAGMVAAYDRLCAAYPDYLKNLEKPDYSGIEDRAKLPKYQAAFKSVNERLEMLRSVAIYYVARKELITDAYYQSHYDHELTPDVSDEMTDEQKNIADKLMDAYYAGRYVMKLKGTSDESMSKRGELIVFNEYAVNLMRQKRKIESSKGSGVLERKDLLKAYYSKYDESAKDGYNYLPSQRRRIIDKMKSDLGDKEFLNDSHKKKYKTPECTKESVESAISEFMRIDMNRFKFKTYPEMFEHFDENMALAGMADKVQALVSFAITEGFDIPDEVLMPLRAKIMAFDQVRSTLYTISSFVYEDTGAIKEPYERWDEYFTSNSARPDVAALPCKDMNTYLAKCRQVVDSEHAAREKTIKTMWRITTGKTAKAKMDKKLLQEKMGQYQKNAFVAEYMKTAEQKSTMAFTNSDRFVTKYAKEHPELFGANFEMNQLPRTAINFIAGREKKEMARLATLLCGNDEQQLQFWVEFYNYATNINISEYNSYPPSNFIKDLEKKTYIANLQANAGVIGANISKLVDKLGDKACTVLGVEKDKLQETTGEMVRKSKILGSFGTGYIIGRIGGFVKVDLGKYRNALSLEDFFENIDADTMLDADEMSVEQAKKYGLSENDADKISLIKGQLSYVQMVITSRPGKQKVKMETDLSELYVEDCMAYDLSAFKKKYPKEEDLKAAIKEYNDGYQEYKKEDDSLASLLVPDFDVNAQVSDDEDEVKTFVNKAEKIFEELLYQDIGDYSFTNWEKLISKSSYRLRHFAELAGNLGPVLDKYKALLEKEKGKENDDSIFALSLSDVQEVASRIEFYRLASEYYSGPENFVDHLSNNKKMNSGKSAKDSLDEIRFKEQGTEALVDQKVLAKRAIDRIQIKRVKHELDLGMTFNEKINDKSFADIKYSVGSPVEKVQNTVNRLTGLLLYTKLPAYDAKNGKQILEGTCNLVTTLYSQLVTQLKETKTAIEKTMKAKVGIISTKMDIDGLYKVIDETIAQCRSDTDMFAEKANSIYGDMVRSKTQKGKEPRLIEVLKSGRSMAYDSDKEGIDLSKAGAGISDITVIKNAEGKTVYFRKEDFAPKEQYDQAVADLMTEVYGDDLTKEQQHIKALTTEILVKKRVLNTFDTVYSAVCDLKYELADKTTTLADIAKKVTPLFANEKLSEYINKAPQEELEKFGHLLIQLYDMENKMHVCFLSKNQSAGIKPGRNLSGRNVATSRLAQLLGIGDMVCESRTAEVKVKDKVVKGNLMEASGGESLADIGNDYKYTKEVVKQTFILEVFDYICGQVDRHFDNFHVITDPKTKTIIGIKAIDNDMSFGTLFAHQLTAGRKNMVALQDFIIRSLPAKVLNRILSLNDENIRVMMGDILEKDEIEALISRVDNVKTMIRDLPKKSNNIKVIPVTIKNTVTEPDENGNNVDVTKDVVVSETIQFTGDLEDEDERALDGLEELDLRIKQINKKGGPLVSMSSVSQFKQNFASDILADRRNKMKKNNSNKELLKF